MSEKITAMIEEIKGLTVLELSELVHALEEEFGVSAADVAIEGHAQHGEQLLLAGQLGHSNNACLIEHLTVHIAGTDIELVLVGLGKLIQDLSGSEGILEMSFDLLLL